ncbi:hflK protein, putative [Nitratidesulfovibrio vulgaris str. Hildenborough]|uniref:Protein HflK n=2 Tax=Nitratidesulfovibrio vulgaris TaxID=881 RepID=Q72E94_NITV2|nr:hflK protein, putative [Nitratidesulfovibrio vulgaris str. Hildenborough]ADP85796.1 HflK protein [Nitratidesulfovibrio vulgaris RCH1]
MQQLPYFFSIMNWDWDKLQEKRQRQTGGWGGGDQGDTPPPSGPDFEKLGDSFRRFREFPFPTGKLAAAAVAVLWLLSGVYIINPDEAGVVLRFGQYDRTVGPGPHYHLPFPVERVYKPKVTQVQRVEIGFRSPTQGATFQQGQGRVFPEEAAMLTGDENIVNVQFSVQYQIKDPVEYLFNVTDQAAVVRNAAEAAMREIIGNSLIDAALTDGKLRIQNETTTLLQEILDRYKVGIRVLAVQMQDVHPPKEVIDAFKDVASAREDKSRIVNEAEAYRNELLPRTRGAAAELVNQAEGYRETRTRQAEGEAQRFIAVLKEYNAAKDVTRKRLYFETMQEILSRNGVERIILPRETAGRVLPYLPLDRLTPAPQTGTKGGN